MSGLNSIGSRTTPPRAFAVFLILEFTTALLLLRHDLDAPARNLIVGVHIVVGFVVLASVVAAAARFLGRRRNGWPWDLVVLLASGVIAAGFGADRDFPLVSGLHAAVGAYVLVRRLLPRRLGFFLFPIVVFLFARASYVQTARPRVEVAYQALPEGPIDGPYKNGYIDASQLDAKSGAIFVDNTRCTMCHNEIVEAHDRSAHRHASLTNPYYTESIRSLAAVRGPDATRACAGCHDVGLVATGRFPEGILSPAAAETLLPGADVGVPCLTCHGATTGNGHRGNGALTLALPRDPVVSSSGWPLFLQKLLTYADPRAHRDAMMPRGSDTSGRCGVCHQAFLHEGINGAAHTRGQTERDDHRRSAYFPQSGASGRLPLGTHRTCRDCHMRDGPAYGEGHQMAAANTALPALLHDDAWTKTTTAYLQSRTGLALTLFEVRGDDVKIAPAQLVPDGEMQLHVLIANTQTGHDVFGGTRDTHDVQVTLHAERHGAALNVLDDKPHRLDRQMVTPEGDTERGHLTERLATPLYDHTIAPGAAHIVRYRLATDRAAQPLAVSARVTHRKFAPDVSRRVGAPVAPQVEVARRASTDAAPVDAQAIALARYADAAGAVWEDNRAASALDAADHIEGVSSAARYEVTLARVRFLLDRRHDREGALALLERTAASPHAEARGETLRARALLAAGRPDEAYAAFQKLSAAFPFDVPLLYQAAQAARRQGASEQALAWLTQLLRLEPDHFEALVLRTALYGERGDAAAVKRSRTEAERVRPARDATAAAVQKARRDVVAAREADRHHVHDVRIATETDAPAAPE